MDALTKAVEEMERVECGEYVDAAFVVAKAQAYATIATAEALARIAAVLEDDLSFYRDAAHQVTQRDN